MMAVVSIITFGKAAYQTICDKMCKFGAKLRKGKLWRLSHCSQMFSQERLPGFGASLIRPLIGEVLLLRGSVVGGNPAKEQEREDVEENPEQEEGGDGLQF